MMPYKTEIAAITKGLQDAFNEVVDGSPVLQQERS